MKQRVAIARGMAMEPDILLMDEPFAALDALTRRRMQDELLRLWDDTRFTVLFVTHSIAEAIRIGNRILLLSPHPGQVRAELDSVPGPITAAEAGAGGAHPRPAVRRGAAEADPEVLPRSLTPASSADAPLADGRAERRAPCCRRGERLWNSGWLRKTLLILPCWR